MLEQVGHCECLHLFMSFHFCSELIVFHCCLFGRCTNVFSHTSVCLYISSYKSSKCGQRFRGQVVLLSIVCLTFNTFRKSVTFSIKDDHWFVKTLFFLFFSPLPTRVTLGNNVKNNVTYYFYNIRYALLWELFKKNHQKTTECPHVNLPYMRCMQGAVRKPQ